MKAEIAREVAVHDFDRRPVRHDGHELAVLDTAILHLDPDHFGDEEKKRANVGTGFSPRRFALLFRSVLRDRCNTATERAATFVQLFMGH